MFVFFEPREMLRFFEARGVFGCTSRTVSYAWELTSVLMSYPQGDGFDTSLSRLRPDLDPLYVCMYVWSSHIVEYRSTG